MTLEFDNILVERPHERVCWITLERPGEMNSFTGELGEELLQALLDAQEDESVRVIVLTGRGRHFCAGGDVDHMQMLREEDAGFEKLRPLIDVTARVVTLVHEMPKPIIAMVNGPAGGGGAALALACDIRIAGEHASFTQDAIHAGLHPDAGASFFLPRLVGTARALELLWTGRPVEAEEAEELGMVQMVVPHPHLREHTLRYSTRLANLSAQSLRLIKLAVTHSPHHDLQGMLDFEVEAIQQCWEARESRKSLRSFAANRRRDPFARG